MLSIEPAMPSATTLGEDRLQPRAFLLQRRSAGASIGPGGFRADIDDIRALGDHAPCLRKRARRGKERAAIGKGIRRDVEDAHHGGVGPRKQRSQQRVFRRWRGRRSSFGSRRDHAVALRGSRFRVKMPHKRYGNGENVRIGGKVTRSMGVLDARRQRVFWLHVTKRSLMKSFPGDRG